jgi:hypothetical protein
MGDKMGGSKCGKATIKAYQDRQMASIRDKMGMDVAKTGRFPSCFGKYPDCPEEAKTFLENKGKEGFKKENAPRNCRLCPFFKW